MVIFEIMDEFKDDCSELNVLKRSINDFEKVVQKPENFLSLQEKKAEKLKSLVKSLYDYGESRDKTKILPKLFIHGMDEEQIWQQLELKNNATWSSSLTQTSKLLSYQENKLNFNYHFANENGSEEEAEDDESMDDEQLDEEEDIDDNDDEDNEDNEDDEEMDQDEEENTNLVIKGDPTKSSIVDDQFFKLDELRQFLDAEDRKEVKKQSGTVIQDPEDEQINYFNDIDDESIGSEDEINVKYSDFFGDDGDTVIEKKIRNKSEIKEKRKKMRNEDLGIDDSEIDEDQAEVETSGVRFNLSKNQYKSDSNADDDDEEDDEDDDDDDEDKQKPRKKLVDIDDDLIPKSNFELRQQRLKQGIEVMEEQALEKKSWQLRGEIDATSRPQNSLLEEVLEFDSSVRPVPIITEETTIRLEDIIKQRIKDKSFDDVERKFKPIDTPYEYRKKLVLDQEKSKESLVQIYEKEYFKQMDALSPNHDANEEKEPKEHTEIRKSITELFKKLDALSNYHYTPKPIAPEIKIINNTPAIEMEEVAPVSVSNAALLAPEEIKQRPKGDIMGRNERTKTDKMRERRQKKTKQKNIKKREEKIEMARAAKGLPLRQKANDKKLLEKVTKSRNVDKMAITENVKEYKSSSAFFAKLQDKLLAGSKADKLKEKKAQKGVKTARQFKM